MWGSFRTLVSLSRVESHSPSSVVLFPGSVSLSWLEHFEIAWRCSWILVRAVFLLAVEQLSPIVTLLSPGCHLSPLNPLCKSLTKRLAESRQWSTWHLGSGWWASCESSRASPSSRHMPRNAAMVSVHATNPRKHWCLLHPQILSETHSDSGTEY